MPDFEKRLVRDLLGHAENETVLGRRLGPAIGTRQSESGGYRYSENARSANGYDLTLTARHFQEPDPLWAEVLARSHLFHPASNGLWCNASMDCQTRM